MKRAVPLILTFSVIILSACEQQQSAENLINDYAKDKAAEAASNINQKIDENEVTSGIKKGVTTAGEYAEDAYTYATDEENINKAKESAKENQQKTKNFFDYMFGEAEDAWNQVLEDAQKKPSEFSGQESKSLEDASEFDFYGDYTNPWMKAQGIDTSSEGTALEQFKVLIGKASEQTKETAKNIKQYHDERHPAAESGADNSDNQDSTDPQTNTYTTQAISNALLNAVPQYHGYPYVIINDNEPFFDESELTTEPFIALSELDSLGRCGVAYMNACKELCPTEERGSIGSIKPSAWAQAKYPILIDEADNPQGYYQCRMHLLAYTLSGLNAEDRNLITGTFQCNLTMEEWELQTSYYVKSNPSVHVLYRVTPIFNENELMARGVLMEARSVERDDLKFCVFVYNVAPGIDIDYATGQSSLSE